MNKEEKISESEEKKERYAIIVKSMGISPETVRIVLFD